MNRNKNQFKRFDFQFWFIQCFRTHWQLRRFVLFIIFGDLYMCLCKCLICLICMFHEFPLPSAKMSKSSRTEHTLAHYYKLWGKWSHASCIFSILWFTWQPIYGMLKKSVCNKEYQKIFMLLGTWNEFWVQYMLLLLLLLLFVTSLALIKKQRLPQPNRSKQNLNHRDLANETFHMESLLK